MKRLDSFAEFVGSSATLGSLREAARPEPADDEADAVTYLDSFPIVIDVMERLPDVIDGTHVIESGSLRTDGVYFWRDDLRHYVERHHVSLPAEFRASVELGVRELSEAELEEAGERDARIWSSIDEVEGGQTS